MHFSTLGGLFAMIACQAFGYTLKFYTDQECTQGEVDFSHPDFPQGGTFGTCTNTGFDALSFIFYPDELGTCCQQNMGTFMTENSRFCQDGVDPYSTDAYYQSGDATCIRTIDSPLLNGKPIREFIVGGNG